MKNVNIKVVEGRLTKFTRDDAKTFIDELLANKWGQIQVRLDSQKKCETVREIVLSEALTRKEQIEITILGSGAAVGIKLPVPVYYIWDEKTRKDVHIDEWNKRKSVEA